jgi:peptidyl-prolyl cis-trans isomerase C
MRVAGPGVLNQLIGNVLVDQQAQEQKIDVPPEEIEANIEQLRQQVAPETLEAALEQRGTTIDIVRNDMRVQIEVSKLLAGTIKPVRMAHVRDILINIRPAGVAPAPGDHQHTEAEARAIATRALEELDAGKSFEDTARRYSEDNGNNAKGGDIGLITDIPGLSTNPAADAFSRQPAFVAAALGLKKGQFTTKPVRTAYGLHLIQAVSTLTDPTPADSHLYSEAMNRVADQQLAAEAPGYVKSLRDAAAVQIYLGAATDGPPGVAATVNGQDITTDQVSKLALRVAGPSILHRLIVNALVDQEAAKQNVHVAPAEIDAMVEQVREENKPVSLEDALAQAHMTMDDLRAIQRIQIEAHKLIAEALPPFKMAHIRHILIAIRSRGASVPPRTKAQAVALVAAIQRALKAGRSFQNLAKLYSDDPSTRGNGGDLGVVTGKDPYDPAFLKAALALTKGAVTGSPVQTSAGLELIQAVSTGRAPLPSDAPLYTAAQARAEAREVQAETHDYIPTLRARSHVVDYLSGQAGPG